MSSRERLETVFSGNKPDRTPILGGWIACPDHICTLAGVDLEAYWADPVKVSIRAYEVLGTDGLIGVFGPLAVTTELPVCTPEEIRDRVRHAIDVCRGNADLVLFTSNTINPDVPLDNIRAMYDAIQ